MSALLDMIRARLAELAAAKQLDPWEPGPDGRVPELVIDSADLGLTCADFPLTETGAHTSHPLIEAEVARFRQREQIAAHRGVIVRIIVHPPECQSYDDTQLELQKSRQNMPPERSRGVLIDGDDRPPNATSGPLSGLVSPSMSTRRSRLRTGWNLSR
jgi:hypothetical protein